MDERRYGNRAFILALIALALSTLPLTMPILTIFLNIFFDIHVTRQTFLGDILGILAVFGCIPGLIIALLAYKMGRRMKGSLLLTNITRITSILAIISALFWGTLTILAVLIGHFAPRW